MATSGTMGMGRCSVTSSKCLMEVSLVLRSALPQTWEDPTTTYSETHAQGDNDPLDVCEIGQSAGFCGQVRQVKVLSVMALLDEGKKDWKLLVIDIKDSLAYELNDIADVKRYFPGLIHATNDRFRIYKVLDCM